MNLPSTPMGAASGWRSVDPPRRPVLFVNPRSGGGKAARSGLAERARERGVQAVILDPGLDLAALARDAAAGGADALGVAGGDGSLAVVAAVAATHGIPFACIPAGTRNHFALDVGVDRHDLAGALDALTDGVERQIDVAEVNGRMFLNNVSLGIYGEAVRQSAYRDARLRTLLATAEEVLGPSGEAPALRLVDDAEREHRDPAVVLVSNNPYALDNPLAPGTRPALDTGLLGIVVFGVPGGTSVRPGRAWTAPRLEVSAPAAVHAGVDGEAVDLSPPLRFAIRPAALRVRISSRHPGASPSARLRLPGPPPPPRANQDQLSDCRPWTRPAGWRHAPRATSGPGKPPGASVTDAEIALSAVAGGLLGLLRSRERHPERVDGASVDRLAEACLRLLGVPACEAARLAASSLPLVGAVSR